MTLKGPFSLILATILFAIAHSAVKYLGDSFSIFQLAFIRFIFAPIFLLPLLYWKKLPFYIHNWKLIGVRTFFGISAMLLYFWSLIQGNPGQVSLIFQSSSIWAFIIGWVWFNERMSKISLASIPVAFIGLYFVTSSAPNTVISLPDALALLASFMNAGVFISLKALRRNHNSHSILLANYSLSSLVLLAPSVIGMGSVHPSALHGLNLWIPLLTVGILGLIGNWLMTVGFKYSAAGLSSTIMLLTVPWMYLSGVLYFGEVLSLRAMLGAILVLASISVMVWRK